jgi:hypothetical protein
MKVKSIIRNLCMLSLFAVNASAQSGDADPIARSLYIDVHDVEPGKVGYKDVANAHARDLVVQGKYNVSFLRYWFDKEKGKIYCLSSAPNADAISQAHAEAHGLVPGHVHEVMQGVDAATKSGRNYFLDIHKLGAGNVTLKDVEAAHEKDLAVQGKYGVRFINYWVDEKQGTVMCLSTATDTLSIVNAHKEAHGLIPAEILHVKQGE